MNNTNPSNPREEELISMAEIVKECTMDGLLIKPCDLLARATSDYQAHYKKGLSIMPIVQLVENAEGKKDFVNTRDYLIVKNGEFQKNGVLCHFCPFCGCDVYGENK